MVILQIDTSVIVGLEKFLVEDDLKSKVFPCKTRKRFKKLLLAVNRSAFCNRETER